MNMDLALNYLKKHEDGNIKLSVEDLDSKTYRLEGKTFDPSTGEESTPEVGIFNLSDIDSQRNIIVSTLEKLQGQLDSIDALITDISEL